jgi:hypothetical protein
MKGNIMKSFRTLEELVEFVSNPENIETLGNGEITLKDWNEDSKALRKYWKEHGQTADDKKAWESQKAELTQRVTVLTEQLDSANLELVGLKEIQSSGEMEVFRKLNAEIIAVRAANKLLEKQVATIPDLRRKIDAWNSSRIVEAAKKAAAHYNVPQNIINDPDFEWIVTNDLAIDDMGNVYVKGAYLQNEYEYIVAKQKDRPHWQPISDSNTVFDEHAAIASLFSQGSSSKNPMPSIGGNDRMTNEEAAIIALFR